MNTLSKLKAAAAPMLATVHANVMSYVKELEARAAEDRIMLIICTLAAAAIGYFIGHASHG